MRIIRLLPFILLAIVGLGLLLLPGGEAAMAQGENLIVNGSFEGQYNSYVPETGQEVGDCPLGVCTTAQVPAGWKPWWIKERPTDVNPEFKPAEFLERVRSGQRAAQYFSFWSTHKAGLRQTVPVPENASVTFSVWGFAWMTESDTSTTSDFGATPNMRIGIDPTGGTNPYSPSVVWSGFQQPLDLYTLFSVQVQAQGNRVTVFTFSAPDVNPGSPNYGFKHTDVYWDDASLTTSGGAAPAPPPPSTNPGTGTQGTQPSDPAPTAPNPFALPPTSTPNAEGVIYSVVQPGDSIWSIAAKAGLTLDEILELNNMSQGDFVSVGDLLIIGYGDPPGQEPVMDESAATEEEVQPEPTATSTPEAVVESEPVEEIQPQASLCLSAYDDSNQNGVRDAGEPLRSAVAFTISDAEKVVSNYVTDGASEPFCIQGLGPGTYRVTRSSTANEITTSATDQSVSVQPGESKTLEFGSYDNVETIAQVQTAGDNATVDNSLADSTLSGDDAEGGSGGSIFIIAVVVAVLLLVGVLVIILSARRMAA